MMQKEYDEGNEEESDSEATSDYVPSEGNQDYKKYKVSDPYIISSSEDEDEHQPPRKQMRL